MRTKVLALIVLSGLVFLSFMNGSFVPATGLNIGDKAPQLEAKLPDGSHFVSDSLKGKMVLIDFWASYDAPSRVDNFRKNMLLERFSESEFLNSDGFVVVSISLDRFKAPFFSSIERDNLFDFYHLCDFQGKDSPLAVTYSISDEFTNFLIDGEGRIVEKSSDLDRIETTLKRLESTDRSKFASNRRW